MSSPLYLHSFLIINWTDKSQLLVLQNFAPPGPKQCSSWVVGSYEGGPLTQIAWEQFMDSFQCPIWKLFLPPHAYRTCDVTTLKGLTTLVRSQANLLIEVSWSFLRHWIPKWTQRKAAARPKAGVNQAHCTETHLRPALEVQRPVSHGQQKKHPWSPAHRNVSSHCAQTWSCSL